MMKRNSVFMLACIVATACVVLLACSKSGGESDNNTGTTAVFKTTMLTNYSDAIIIPAYTALQGQLALLDASANAFLVSPSVTTQEALKVVFKNAWLSYENVSVMAFGPADAVQLRNFLNTFPTVAVKIEAGITSGTYNLTLPVVSDSIQGFPALDYLFFSADAVAKFSAGGTAATNRKKYVQDIITRMKLLTDNVLAQWKGNYRAGFIASTKTDVGSSIGYLVNQFAFEMDALKGPRIGWPFGKMSNGIVFADKCEGYYAGFSAALAVTNLTSLKNYYIGGAGDGIADYLVLLKKEQLNNDVLAQFEIALTALKAIPDPMSVAFTANAPLIEEAYRQVQKLLTLLKTDVASATAVQITYMDNDGD